MNTRSALGYLAAVAVAIAVPAAFLPAHALIQGRPGTVALAQVIAVLVIASYWGTRPAVAASLAGVLAWNYWFLPPYFSFKLEQLSRDELALLAAFLVASILVGQLSSYVRSRAIQAELARKETERLYAELKRENAWRQQAEAALREREARIRRLVDANIIGIRFTDADGVTTDANDAYLEMLGYSREDLASGKLNLSSLTPPEYAAADQRAIDEMSRTGRWTPFEKEYLRKDGQRVPVLVGGALLDGGRATSVAFVLDLTERKRAEAEREARLAAELATRAKSEFLAHMSHELRTPLNSILGYAQILKYDPALSDKQSAGLDTIEASGWHLLTLINDILDLSRIECGRLDLSLSPMDLAACLHLVSDIVRVQARQRGLAFQLELEPGLPQTISVDEKRLRQVLLNLLGNSVKFTDVGQVTLRVGGAALAPARFKLQVDVYDTGIGIPAEHLAKIFEPFEQLGEAKRRTAGAGLGLAISRALVRLMGGEIRVESSAKGSRFGFDVEVTVVEDTARPSIGERKVSGYEGPRKSVLIVDDVETNRAMLVAYLGTLGFETVEAANGLEALERAEAAPADLVLMDTMMPVMDGLEATRRLRSSAFGAGVPIIAVSARAFAADAESCLQAGANAFLVKPVDFGRLLALIGSLLKLTWT
jgi:PAS domain S-box-containing protein